MLPLTKIYKETHSTPKARSEGEVTVKTTMPTRGSRTPWANVPEVRRHIMRSIRPGYTKPERFVRNMLHRLGYRFRVRGMRLPGRPDIVFPARKRVIFVHGCFWHAHEGCGRGKPPRSRTDYWLPKLSETRKRDRHNIEALIAAGWEALVLWECELSDASDTRERVCRFLGPPLWRPPS